MGGDGSKSWLAGVYDRAAPTYDRVGQSYHEIFGGRLVRRAEPAPAATVLDVACGKGAVMAPAADLVGPAGLVVGVDLSSEMCRLGREEMGSLGHENCRTLVMDAEDLAFVDGVFDGVFCSFAVHLIPDPGRVAAEFARVLKPGGKLAISSWGEGDPRWEWESDLIAGLRVDHRSIAQPFDTPESLSEFLAGAGLRDVRVVSEELDVVFADEDEWWAWKWSYSLRGMLEQLDDESLERFRSDASKRLSDLEQEGGYPFRLRANFALGTNPVVSPG